MALSSVETVYLGRQNYISLILQADGVAVSQTTSSAMKLQMGKIIIQSTNNATDPIRWAQTGYATGEVRIKIGQAATHRPLLYAGKYEAALVVFGATYSSGLVWDNNIPIRVISDPLTT